MAVIEILYAHHILGETSPSPISIIFHGITHYGLVHRPRINRGGGTEWLNTVEAGHIELGVCLKLRTPKHNVSRGRNFLENKRKIPAFKFQDDLFLSSSLADMMAGATTEVPITFHAHLCVRVSEKRSKIFVFIFFGNCSSMNKSCSSFRGC